MDSIDMQQNSPKFSSDGKSGVNTVANLDVILESAKECIRKSAEDSKESKVSAVNEPEPVKKLDPSDNVSYSPPTVSPIVNFDDNLILVTSDTEIHAVLVNLNPKSDFSYYDIKDSCVRNKREKVLSKLNGYYKSSSINFASQFNKLRCITDGPRSNSVETNMVTAVMKTNGISNQHHMSQNSSGVKNFNDESNSSFHDSTTVHKNLEQRFVLVGSPEVKNSNYSSSLKKQVSLNKLNRSSSGKSRGKASPSRRKSIMHPLTCSPSSSDHTERKHLDFSPSSPRGFSSDHLSKLTTSLVLFSNDLCSKNTHMDVEGELVSGKRKQESSEEVTENSTKRVKTELNNIFDNFDKKKERKPWSRRKTPHLVLNKFNKKRKKASSASSTTRKAEGATYGPEEYEVEYLESHQVLENNQCIFFVKWVGWDSCDNSWEPITNLLNCQEKLVDYFGKLLKAGKQQEIETLLNNAMLSSLRQSLLQATDEEVDRLLASYRSKGGLQLPCPNKEFIERALQFITKKNSAEVPESVRERLKAELLLEKLCVKRKAQLNALKEWELEINFLAQNSAQISVENDFDLEGPPPNFNYINHYLPGAGVIIPNDPPFGCDCPGGCTQDSQQCCGKESGFAYDHNGRIKVPCGTPIYECNNRCTCTVECRNRVIQRGQHHRLCIFRTFNGCGWGVKTLEDIKKGSFITKYVGEVVTADEATNRAESDSKFYLFDLDFNSPENSPCPFTVDASIYGNISHFINHSCDPNLAIYAAWINCLDPNIPLLVLFAIKDIRKGDELCFSYSRTDKTRRRKGEVKCKCNALNCRKYVF